MFNHLKLHRFCLTARLIDMQILKFKPQSMALVQPSDWLRRKGFMAGSVSFSVVINASEKQSLSRPFLSIA